MNRVKTSLMVGASATVFVFAFAASSATAAGQAKDKDTGSEITEVVVTARGRKEKILETPVAISAMSAEKIEQMGVTSLTDVARYTPGMTENATITSSGRNDRSFSQFILRGIMPSDVDIPTTTTFLDGAPLSAGAVDGVDDLERIETLKGPQAAYFGRQTFGGAISLVTKDPSLTPALTLNGILATQNLTEGRITLEGPIGDGDKLAARISYRYSDQDGYYKNSATWRTHERVGDRQTQNVNLTIVAKPVENLKIKFTGMYRHDKDGPSAQVYIAPSYSNCTTPAGSWFCGTVPTATKKITINDVVTPDIKAFVAAGQTTGRQVKTVDEFGLERDAFHGGVNAEYYAPNLDLTFVSITGVDQQVFGQMQDFDNQDSRLVNYVFSVSKRNRNVSQEFRVISNQDNAFRWLAGGSYAWQRVDTSLASSLLAFGASSNSYTPSSSSSSQTLAAFFGLTYDLTQKLTLNLEGRYQSDEVNSGGQSATYKTFLPRAIAQYHFTDRVMGYATYSKGVNPGPFNSPRALDALTPANRADFISRYGFGVEVLPEKLQNFEAGVKGTFLDGKLSVSADAYYDEWSNQINYVTRYYTQGPDLVGVFAKVNNGKIKLSGVELEGTYRPVRRFEINFGGAINDTNIRAGSCITCNEITGNPDTHVYRGNELNNVSKYQSILGASYYGDFKALPGADWFANINYSYKSGSYVSNDNLLKTPDQNTVDVRAGISKGPLSTELFVRNLFDAQYFTNATNFYNVVTLDFRRANALLAGIAPGRSFGLRLKYVWR